MANNNIGAISAMLQFYKDNGDRFCLIDGDMQRNYIVEGLWNLYDRWPRTNYEMFVRGRLWIQNNILSIYELNKQLDHHDHKSAK